MHEAIERLLNGDQRIPDHFAATKALWERFFAENEAQDADGWAKDLSMLQQEIEMACDLDRDLGKEIMPWTGFGTLYDTRAGFEDRLPRAIKLAKAFARSMCSLEVKSEAERVVYFYSLNHEPELAEEVARSPW